VNSSVYEKLLLSVRHLAPRITIYVPKPKQCFKRSIKEKLLFLLQILLILQHFTNSFHIANCNDRYKQVKHFFATSAKLITLIINWIIGITTSFNNKVSIESACFQAFVMSSSAIRIFESGEIFAFTCNLFKLYYKVAI
jgi:hypothetical protein